MTSNEIKREIQNVLDKVPDALLSDILDYLKTIREKSVHSVRLSSDLRKIISEDIELLEKLAQ
ncbi:MAG TPA: hypothetical protein VI757_03990 [Bacteroidia bacterium]|nr:hypothetical protein [Bacteroidia bacterium]